MEANAYLVHFLLYCSGISRTLDRIEFCKPTPILENHIRGCHGNHAFLHSPYQKKFEDNFVSHSGGLNEQFGTHEKLSCGVQGILNWGCPGNSLLPLQLVLKLRVIYCVAL